MSFSHGVDIQKGKKLVVFRNFIRRDFSRDDSAENGWHGDFFF
jgi:hypothetical protein